MFRLSGKRYIHMKQNNKMIKLSSDYNGSVLISFKIVTWEAIYFVLWKKTRKNKHAQKSADLKLQPKNVKYFNIWCAWKYVLKFPCCPKLLVYRGCFIPLVYRGIKDVSLMRKKSSRQVLSIFNFQLKYINKQSIKLKQNKTNV